MPLIRQLLNRDTGAITTFGTYMKIEDYKKFKKIMDEYIVLIDIETAKKQEK